jgi:hypothetical protein
VRKLTKPLPADLSPTAQLAHGSDDQIEETIAQAKATSDIQADRRTDTAAGQAGIAT